MNFINERNIGPMYIKRLETDRLFEAAQGSFSYDSEYNRAAKFVESHQSKNLALWASFIEPFKLQVDGKDGGWSGEFYGKMMRGACLIYKYTQDSELYSILENTVRYLFSCAEKDGRISTYDREKEFLNWDMWCRKYVLLGTQYFYEICKDEDFKKEIVKVLSNHLNYIIAHIGDGDGKKDILESTEENPAPWGALNSSSILEPVVRQYYLTGERRYLDFASYIIKRGGSAWGNIYSLAVKGDVPPYEYPVTKAYEATSFFEGVLEYYRATGDEDAKRAFVNFVSKVIETDFTVIGCSGCTHELFDHSSVMQTEFHEKVNQETCVTVTLMKAFYQALCLTGEAKYANAMERAGYNAMLGAINFPKNTIPPSNMVARQRYGYDDVTPFTRLIGGYTFDSYSPLYKSRRNRDIGGFRRLSGDKSYGCCACIGSSGVAIMPLSSVMLSKDGIRINHLMDGSVTLDGLTLNIVTEYPYSDSATITVNTDLKEAFSIGIRVPSFTSGVTVNGFEAAPDELGYATITKVWENGEKICIRIPKNIVATELNGKISVSSGIVVLAVDERIESVDVKVTEKIIKTEKISVPFHVREAYNVTFDNGTTVKMVDFSSAGWDFGHEKGLVSVWLDKE